MGVLPQANLDGHLRDRVFQDIPVRVTWRGAWDAVRSSPDIIQTLIIGGVEELIAYQLFFRAASLPQAPTVGEIMVVDNIKMRVLGVKTSPDGNLYTCQMGFSKER